MAAPVAMAQPVAAAPPVATTPSQPAEGGAMAALMELKQMLEAGLISQGDFDTKKADLLSRM